MATDAEIIDAVAAIGRDVVGFNDEAVYGPGTASGQALGVKELPDDIGASLPAFLMLDGEAPIQSRSHERQRWVLAGSVWSEYQPRGQRYRELLALREPIHAAFRAKSKAGLVDPDVQSVLILEFAAIQGRQWTRSENAPWYLVLPFTVEVVVTRAVTYLPA